MKKNILLWVILLLPYLGIFFIWQYHRSEIDKIANSSFIIISKEEMTLSLYDYKGKMLAKYPVACGKNLGSKQGQGDMRTPEGIFTVCDIQDATHWAHDFGDGNGKIEGAYGPFFIRLLTPGYRGIGIHGTHDDKSIGTRTTEGCIRMKNGDLKKLVKKIKIGDVVVITPAKLDVSIDSIPVS